MVELICQVCGQPFEAKRSTAKYCSERCKKRNQRGAGAKNAEDRSKSKSESGGAGLGSVAAATMLELQEAKRIHTPLGQAALALAHRLDMSATDTGAGVASLAKQLQSTLEAATADAQVEDDPVDEVGARRDAKLRAVTG